MDQENKTNSFLIKKLSLFDTKQSKQLIESISLVVEGHFPSSSTTTDDNSEEKSKKANQLMRDLQRDLKDASLLSQSIVCTVCNCSFNDRDEQIEHIRGDLHLFNLKQKLRGKKICTAEEFENLSDISSISGASESELEESSSSKSESDNEDKNDDNDENNSKLRRYESVARSKPKITFRLSDSTLLVMFRCILHAKKNVPESEKELMDQVKSLRIDDQWAVVLIAAGHFAAAVFKGDQPILHKTFHRYVVRAKRGTVQSQHDCCGRNAKSAGANIRRSQEAAFKDDIRLLLGSEWKTELEKCKCIFIRVPRYNKPVLFSTNSSSAASNTAAPFDKHDKRIRHIPFMTFRPTFNEVKRTHILLSKIEIYKSDYLDLMEKYQKKLVVVESPVSQAKPKKKSKNKSKPSKNVTEESTSHQQTADNEEADLNDYEEADNDAEDDDDNPQIDYETEASKIEVNVKDDDFIQSLNQDYLKLFNDFYTYCLTNNAKKLEEKFNEILVGKSTSTNLDGSFRMEIDDEKRLLLESLLNKRINRENGFTLLHLTSELGNHECVWQLLMHGANPAICDLTRQKRYPYSIASTKQARDQFRLFMNDYPTKYDYKQAKVPSALNREKLNEKSEKEKEKKRNQRKQKKERQSQQKKQQQTQENELDERKRFLALTDQEKRQLVLDRNFLSILPIKQQESPTTTTTTFSSAAVSATTTATTTTSPKEKFSLENLKVISRCWYCGINMATSQPFEYFDYKFCSTKCLKAHRTGTNSSAQQSSK